MTLLTRGGWLLSVWDGVGVGGGAGFMRTIVLRKARHHHLRVALGAQGAALQQRLAEVHAARVDVQPAHVWVEEGPV